MLRYISYLLLFVTLTGCTAYPPLSQQKVDSTEVSRIILTYASKLNYDHHLHLEDSVVYYENKINRIRLDFSSMDSIDLWEARELLVEVVEGLLDRVNANALIYPNLGYTPFSPENLEVYITFKSFYTIYVDLQTVGLITLRNGIANYIAADGLDCDVDCWHKRSEYYYQSRNFVTFRRQGEALYRPDKLYKTKKPVFEEERYYSIDVGAKAN